MKLLIITKVCLQILHCMMHGFLIEYYAQVLLYRSENYFHTGQITRIASDFKVGDACIYAEAGMCCCASQSSDGVF